MPPHITREELSMAAERFLEITEQAQIRSFQDVRNSVGKTFLYRNNVNEYVGVEQRSGAIKNLYNPIIMRYVTSCDDSFRTAFELRIYEESKEINIIVTAEFPLKEYITLKTPETNDSASISIRRFHTSEFGEVQDAMRNLVHK